MKDKDIFSVILILILVTLPIGFAINSTAVIFLFVFTLYRVLFKKNKVKLSIIPILLITLYVFSFLSLIWTTDIENTKEALIRFLSYLVIPLSFIFNSDIKVDKHKIICFFLKSLVLFAIYCLVLGLIKSLKNSDISYLFYHKLSNNFKELNAIYLSAYTSFVICFLIHKKNKSKLDKIIFLLLGIFLILLSSKIIIFITFLIVLFFFVGKLKYEKVKFQRLLLVLGISLFFLMAMSNLSKRVKIEFEKTKIEEVLSKKDFGHVYLWTGSGLRAFQTKVFFEILKENEKLLLGFGLNNSQKSLNNKYKEYNLYPGFFGYNYHNQYIQTFAELGLIGFSIVLILLFLIIRNAIIYKDYFLLCFIIIILAVCFTESFLWRQRGMIFFITTTLLLIKTKRIST
ncbi:O-antigen ligase family protein [Polaribacter porphyrae]|uniref:O-antigen ligase-related domain-containing protein n=1 Tax=Polaribacter porphyrae TaxID=1137780 RepID=A0A2S7WS38_9FLAO|nr:O-antigen ligase family protein [Polaribacter porphyrae]PQJ80417.1 hypothetical protein BTO18_15105 [Polaribacter porphyrae]